MMEPSGMCTSRSMMARRMRQWRPMLTWLNTMLASTSEEEFTRVSGDKMLPRTAPPEMMQPCDTMESNAEPMRLGSENTNLAGGYCRWKVRMGHCSSYRLNTGATEIKSMFAS